MLLDEYCLQAAREIEKTKNFIENMTVLMLMLEQVERLS